MFYQSLSWLLIETCASKLSFYRNIFLEFWLEVSSSMWQIYTEPCAQPTAWTTPFPSISRTERQTPLIAKVFWGLVITSRYPRRYKLSFSKVIHWKLHCFHVWLLLDLYIDFAKVKYLKKIVLPEKLFQLQFVRIRVIHFGSDQWEGDWVKITLSDGTVKMCLPDPQTIYPDMINSATFLINDNQYMLATCV